MHIVAFTSGVSPGHAVDLQHDGATDGATASPESGVSPGHAVGLQHDGATDGATASPEGLELLKMNRMAIPGDTIELMDTIGKGVHGTTLIILNSSTIRTS